MSEELQAIQDGIEQRLANFRMYARRTVREAWRIGEQLTFAKELTPHGEWLLFLERIGLRRDTAADFMRIQRGFEIGEVASLFGSVDQALRALAPPKDESEAETEPEAGPATASVRIDDGEEVKVDVESPVKLVVLDADEDDYQGPETGEAPPIQEKPGLSASEKAIVERQELEMEIASLRQSVEDLTHTNSTLQMQVDAIGDGDRPQLEDGVAQIAEVRAELEQCVAARHTLANQLKDTKKELAGAKRFPDKRPEAPREGNRQHTRGVRSPRK